jgi:hypothetical protein
MNDSITSPDPQVDPPMPKSFFKQLSIIRKYFENDSLIGCITSSSISRILVNLRFILFVLDILYDSLLTLLWTLIHYFSNDSKTTRFDGVMRVILGKQKLYASLIHPLIYVAVVKLESTVGLSMLLVLSLRAVHGVLSGVTLNYMDEKSDKFSSNVGNKGKEDNKLTKPVFRPWTASRFLLYFVGSMMLLIFLKIIIMLGLVGKFTNGVDSGQGFKTLQQQYYRSIRCPPTWTRTSVNQHSLNVKPLLCCFSVLIPSNSNCRFRTFFGSTRLLNNDHCAMYSSTRYLNPEENGSQDTRNLYLKSDLVDLWLRIH